MPLEIMQESSNFKEPERRRSARLSPPQASVTSDNKMAPPAFVQRRITVRKIAPRKTTLAPSEYNKENTPKRAVSEGVQEKKQKICTPENVPGRKSSSGKNKQPTMPSPIHPSPPAPLTAQTPKSQTPKSQNQPQTNQEDPVWSNKVRRSYSRLSDKSFNSPNSRETLFGFEKLQTPEVMRKVGQNKSNLEGSLSALASFTSLLEAEDCNVEPDLNIPGVTVVKEKKKRKKVQQIASNELDELAAKMNAEFEEAEEFELVVE